LLTVISRRAGRYLSWTHKKKYKHLISINLSRNIWISAAKIFFVSGRKWGWSSIETVTHRSIIVYEHTYFFNLALSEMYVRDECLFSNFTLPKWNISVADLLNCIIDTVPVFLGVTRKLISELCLRRCLTRSCVCLNFERSNTMQICPFWRRTISRPVVVYCHRLHVVMQAMTAVGTVLSITLRWSVSVVTLHCKYGVPFCYKALHISQYTCIHACCQWFRIAWDTRRNLKVYELCQYNKFIFALQIGVLHFLNSPLRSLYAGPSAFPAVSLIFVWNIHLWRRYTDTLCLYVG
jgi:hypothetical protein